MEAKVANPRLRGETDPPSIKPSVFESDVTIYNSDAAAAYVASMIDGEGHVSVHKGKAKTQSGTAYTARVVIVNTDLDLLYRIRDMLGKRGKVGVKSRIAGHKVAYTLSIPSRDMLSVLSACSPYFVAKRKQVMMVAAFRRIVDHSPWHGCANHELYERIHMECKVLNRRGG